jgi:hypothetical protein
MPDSPIPDAPDLQFERAQYAAAPIEPTTIYPPEAPPFDYVVANAGASAAFARAILYGIGAAIAASLLYALFTIVTHIQIGYAALAVAWMIGKAIMAGSGQRGGRNYQIAAAILTYLSVSMSAVPQILWTLHQKGHSFGKINLNGLLVISWYGVASPFLELTEGLGGIITLIILVVGIRAAWRLTSANNNTAHHPFSA